MNKVSVNVYERLRPRGDFKNIKMTGMAAQAPKAFIASLMDFERRNQWDGMFEDGVVVEAIDVGEPPVLTDKGVAKTVLSPTAPPRLVMPTISEKEAKEAKPVVRTTDDVNTFLQTVDLAGGNVTFTSILMWLEINSVVYLFYFILV